MSTVATNLKRISIEPVTRVEGHGNILVRVRDGKLEEARWDVVETPRYFEVMLREKHYTSAGILTSRICGICSIGHCLASIRATEAAFGTETTEVAEMLRLLAKHGETLQSHYLHIFFLALPDFLNLPSAIPLLESNPEVAAIAFRLKGLGNRICDLVAGRTTHPVSLQVGGVAKMPDPGRLRQIGEELKKSLVELKEVVEIFKTLKIPDFVREKEFVALKGELILPVERGFKSTQGIYPFIGGKLISTDGLEREESEYLSMTNEYLDPNNTSKWCKLSRESFAVGALARFNNNCCLLHPEAIEIGSVLGLEPVCYNPFYNNIAQLVECIHVTHDSLRIIDNIISRIDEPTMVKVEPRAGKGVGAVEVPRGILYHCYDYDSQGYIKSADCVIPTTQNNANIHHDLKKLVTDLSDQHSEKELEKLCSMLVRAYDPCISCSVH